MKNWFTTLVPRYRTHLAAAALRALVWLLSLMCTRSRLDPHICQRFRAATRRSHVAPEIRAAGVHGAAEPLLSHGTYRLDPDMPLGVVAVQTAHHPSRTQMILQVSLRPLLTLFNILLCSCIHSVAPPPHAPWATQGAMYRPRCQALDEESPRRCQALDVPPSIKKSRCKAPLCMVATCAVCHLATPHR